MRYTLKGFEVILPHLDKAESFDRIEQHYLVFVLAQFGLCLVFLRWIFLRYGNIDSIVRLNGLFLTVLHQALGSPTMSSFTTFVRDGS